MARAHVWVDVVGVLPQRRAAVAVVHRLHLRRAALVACDMHLPVC